MKISVTNSQSYALLHVNEPQFAWWNQQGYFDKKSHALFLEAFDWRRKMAEADATMQRLDQERAKLHEDQGRIRENLTALGERVSEKELRERYVRTLTQSEDRLEAIAKEREGVRLHRESAEKSLSEVFARMEYDGAPTK